MKMPNPARSSSFHICDILDLNDAKVHAGDPSVVSGTMSGNRALSFITNLARVMNGIMPERTTFYRKILEPHSQKLTIILLNCLKTKLASSASY